VPGPGAFDDFFDGLEFRGPAKFALDFVGAGNEAGGVARAAGFLDYGNGFAGDFFAGGDDFADAGAAAGAEVVEGAALYAEGEDVGLGEVDDVDIVADAGAVRGLVVGAVDFDVRFLAEGDLDDVRDEVGLAAVVFAISDGGAGGVEVAEGDEFEAVDFVVPAKDFLEEEFRLAVGVDGALGEGFVDGEAGGPKVAQVEEKTKRFVPWWIMASRRLRPPPTLLRKYLEGSCIDSPTRALAAKCMTASGRTWPTAAKMASRFWRSPSMSGARGSMARRWPSVRLSKMVTLWPWSRSCSTQMLPIYPAPPVTSRFMEMELGDCRKIRATHSNSRAEG
jgi:hypothetical protein